MANRPPIPGKIDQGIKKAVEIRRWRSWIPGIVFWVLFLASLGLAARYPWLDTVWYAVWMLFLLVVAVYAVADIFRHRHDHGRFVGYRGVPRWVVRFFGDDENSK